VLTVAQIAVILATTFSASLLFTWLVRAVMRRAGIMDRPTEARKIHRVPVAYEGGLALWLGFVTGLIVFCITFPGCIFFSDQVTGLMLGGSLIVALGAADDLMNLSPLFKLAVQLIIGILMHHYGFRIERLSNPFGDQLTVWPYAGYLVTALWYALLMNGFNMIDGMDGLAAGIAGISAVTLAAIAVELQQPLAVALGVITAGICLGFLKFNFIPATIFMGDAGSLLLGFLLASISLLSSSKAPALVALILPMLAVGLPLFETGFAVVRRLAQRQHPFRADKRHLHHRFLSMGFSERRTVLTFYYITAYFGVTAYVLQRMEAKATLALVAIIAVGMVVLVENMRFIEKARLRAGDSAERE
jgi:UDP-GlcNAc:undecaprenyl-phosphate/decaprenyl-phosphate GlcNAc-1-phosphate transferase